MKTVSRLLAASVIGAGLMYLLDPERGRRRRARVRDKVRSAGTEVAEGADVTARDMRNRAWGQVARVRSLITRRPLSDHEIGERIRAELGFIVRHPSAITVRVDDGHVVLTGPILADEVDRVLAAVSAVRGVRRVDNHLEVHREPGNVPGLQGEPRPPRGRRWPFMQRSWSPTTRAMAGAGGLALGITGLATGGLGGAVLGLAGLAALTRGVTNLELTRLTGIRVGRRAITVQKTITVGAPVDEVFAFWRRYENFARFMAHVREVRRVDETRSRWVVAGPGGAPIEWETEETALVPNELLAWRTVAGSLAEHAGVVRFEPAPGGTRIHVRMSYTPPAGALGHAVLALFGGDPKTAMDEDLVRFKSLFEDGKTTVRGETVERRELAS